MTYQNRKEALQRGDQIAGRARGLVTRRIGEEMRKIVITDTIAIGTKKLVRKKLVSK